MISILRAARGAALWAIPAATAWAQAPIPARPMPAASATSAVATSYRSALEGYAGYADVAVRPWREVNDQVGRIGGWRVYAREGQAHGAAPMSGQGGHAGHGSAGGGTPERAAPAASSSSAVGAASAAGHGGHAGHRP